MPSVILYHTDGCHLCELAHEIVIEAGLESQLSLRDIVDDESLMAEYQTTIPVIEFESGNKLFWPFTLQDILENK